MLNPTHLRTLVTVLRTGSFADAARVLGYTGSAVSQQMAALERVVRTPLFEREAHSVRPTPTAELLARRSEGVLAGLTALERDIEGVVDGTIGRLRVCSFPTASHRLVPDWLAAHHRRRPGVEIVLDEDEPEVTLARLAAAELDLGLVYRYDLAPHPWPRGLRRVRVLDEDLLLLLPEGHDLADRPQPAVAELAPYPWVGTREDTDGALALRRACAAAGFEPAVAYRSNDYTVIRSLVRAGLGLAVVPSLGWTPTPGVTARPLADLPVRRHLFAVHRAAGAQQVIADIVDDLLRVAAALTAPAPGP